MPLPPLPRLVVHEIEDMSPADPGSFLRLRRRRLQIDQGDGLSDPFVFDNVDRKALDAVVVAAHFSRDGERWVYLRSAVRPALALRPESQRPLPEKDSLGLLWELPAGLVEPGEVSAEGLRTSASRELAEELGFALATERFVPLGPSSFPACGIIGERHHFFHVEVDPARRGHPHEDGSVLERGARIAELRLREALELARRGLIEDAKTELGLRRLAEI